MTILYLDNPISAAWLQQEYEIRFCNWDDPYAENKDLCWVDVEICAAIKHKLRYYVHPDSISPLRQLPESKIAALQELGMWPEEM